MKRKGSMIRVNFGAMGRSLSAFFSLCCAFALAADEASTARYFDAIREDPVQLRMFLQQMPKGGDLHNHLSGTTYAESFIKFAANDNLCIDTEARSYVNCSSSSHTQVPASYALTSSWLYTDMLGALSMRQFVNSPGESGHDHFFATFGKFSAVSSRHVPEMLAEVVGRFASENVDYVESLFSQDGGQAASLASRLEDKDKATYATMREALLAKGARDVVAAAINNINNAEAKVKETLCNPAKKKPGCESTIRYLYETHRAFPREALFAELLVGFELATKDKRVVGINSVQPEDSYASIAGFANLMEMIAYLRPLYPGVRVSLHAGELAPGLVAPEELRYHITDSVLRAGAERIGHGVDIAFENDAEKLLRTMKERGVAVEICLTSNDVILGVKGKRHPLRLYMSRGVPVVLATDDAGVSRGDLTAEFQRAAEEHGLTYLDLKRAARNSIEYSFLADADKARERERLEQKLLAFETQWSSTSSTGATPRP